MWAKDTTGLGFFDPIERMEFEEYTNKDISRANKTMAKVGRMKAAFLENSPGRKEAYEQISLPV